MSKFIARVDVFLKKGYSDPEGEATRKSLIDLGYAVSRVRVSKVYSIFLDAKNISEAKQIAEDMCRVLLVNPNKDDFQIAIEDWEREG
jgi:phosphoribosylformylglycinamidine synthase PurS subunit